MERVGGRRGAGEIEGSKLQLVRDDGSHVRSLFLPSFKGERRLNFPPLALLAQGGRSSGSRAAAVAVAAAAAASVEKET